MRALRVLSFVVLGVVVFAASLVLGVAVHRDMPVSRRAALDLVHGALARSFLGEVRIERVRAYDFAGVRDARVVVIDPEGVVVLTADHVDASLSVFAAARAALVGDAVTIDAARVGVVDVSLDRTEAGLRLARAFAARNPSGQSAPAFRLAIHQIVVAHAWVHGEMPGQWVDVDVDDARATLTIDRGGVVVEFGAAVAVRAIPRGANVEGHVHGALAYGDALYLTGAFTGLVGGIGVRALGSLEGDRFAIHVEVPNAPVDRLQALLPEVPIREGGSVTANVEGRVDAFAADASVAYGGAHVVAIGRYVRGALYGRAIADHVDARAFASSVGHTDIHADVSAVRVDGIASVVALVQLPGASAEVASTIRPSELIDVDSRIHIVDAARALAPLGIHTTVRGRGDAYASARIDGIRGLIAGEAAGDLRQVAIDSVSIGAIDAHAAVAGSIRDPSFSTDMRAETIVVPRLEVSSAAVRIRGTLHDADVTAKLNAKGPFDLHARVTTDAGGVTVRDAAILSDGKAIVGGSLTWNDGTAHAIIDAREVDLDQVRRTLGAHIPLAGRVSLGLDVRVSPTAIDGHAIVDAAHVDYGSAHDVNAHIEIAALGGVWSVVSRGQLGTVGWLSAETTDLKPVGSPFDVESWRRATGSVRIDAGASLGRIEALVGSPARFEGDGRVAVVVRRVGMEAPRVHLDGSIARLSFDRVRALEVDVHADADSTPAWAELVHGRAPSREVLERVPLVVDASVPTHEASAVCKAFDIQCRGAFSLAVHGSGTIHAPHGTLKMALGAFRSGASPFDGAVDGTVDAEYVDGLGRARFAMRSTASASQTINGDAEVHVPAAWREWYASFNARAQDMPFRAPPAFVDSSVRGRLSGSATLTNFRRDARSRVDLDIADLEIDDARSDHAKLEGSFDGSKLSLVARVTAKDSSLDLRADATATWASAWVPVLEAGSLVTVALQAKDFRASNLMPLVPPEVGQVDGRIDADASAKFVFGSSSVSLRGWLAVKDGLLQSSSIGPLHDIQGRITMQPDGSLVLDRAQARGTTGLIRIGGRAQALGGSIQEVALTADIHNGEAFPVVVGGDHVGDAWGHLELSARHRDGGFDVSVKAPTLHVLLPDSGYRDLQSLAAAPTITTGVRSRSGQFVPLQIDARVAPKSRSVSWSVSVDLGDDVEVERSNMLKVRVSGHPRIDIGDRTLVTGQLVLTRGALDIQGKRFQIDYGVATFNGDPSNPTLVLTATWDAPDGSRVFADYRGPIQGGKLTLRSEPAHTRDEIVSLLVFGAADGPTPSTGTMGDAAANQALGTGASLATQPLNKAISQLTHLDIKTRVDTSSAAGPQSEVEIQLTKDVSAQVAYVLGLPPPGTNPDRTWLTLMFHMTARWSLGLTVGDHGSSIVDLLWHHRY